MCGMWSFHESLILLCERRRCTDDCDSAVYEGGRGDISFVNNTLNGMFESEVSNNAVITGNNVNHSRLEVG
jgi:hypothetical protein